MKFILLFFALMISNNILAADLEVTVKALRNGEGQLRMAIFDGPSEFPRGDEIRSLNIKAKTGDIKTLIKGMKSGTYAIAVHHDENFNEQMDTNFLGLPEEGYGFSNDAKVFFGPPNFQEASFTINAEQKKISIHIIY